MGVKLDDLKEADDYRSKVIGMGDMLLERFLRPWLHDPKVYRWSPLRFRMDRRVAPLHRFTNNVIQTRRQNASPASLLGATPEQKQAASASDDNM